jgi:ERCC4-related helicase
MKFRFSFLIFFSFLFVIFTISLFLRYKFSHKESFVIQPNIGIVSMMKNPKNIETWLEIHRNLGIKRFYIRLEDTPELVEFLKSQSDVKTDISQSTGVNEYVEIQNRQAKMVDKALQDGRNDGIDWLIHIDSDEILKGNLEEIANLPETTRTFWMQNYEALYSNVPEE